MYNMKALKNNNLGYYLSSHKKRGKLNLTKFEKNQKQNRKPKKEIS